MGGKEPAPCRLNPPHYLKKRRLQKMTQLLIRGSETTVVGITTNHEIAFKIDKSNWKGELHKKEYEKVMEATIELMNPTGE